MFPDPSTATVEMARSYFQRFVPATLTFHTVCRLISSAWIVTYTSEVPVALENCTLIKSKIQQKFNNICKVSSVLPIESTTGKYWQVTLKPMSTSILTTIATCVFVRSENPDTLNQCSIQDESKLLHSFANDVPKPSKIIFNGRNVTKLFTGASRLSVKVLSQLTPTMTPKSAKAHLQRSHKKEKVIKAALKVEKSTGETIPAKVPSRSDVKNPIVHKTSSKFSDPTNIYDSMDKAVQLKYIREHIHLVISALALIKAIVTKRAEHQHHQVSELKSELLHKMLILKSLGLYCDEVTLVDLCKLFVATTNTDRVTFNLLIDREASVVVNDVFKRSSSLSVSRGYGTSQSMGILDLPESQIRV